MSFKWYVVHVYSGSEKRVKDTIEEQVKAKNMNEYISCSKSEIVFLSFSLCLLNSGTLP